MYVADYNGPCFLCLFFSCAFVRHMPTPTTKMKVVGGALRRSSACSCGIEKFAIICTFVVFSNFVGPNCGSNGPMSFPISPSGPTLGSEVRW